MRRRKIEEKSQTTEKEIWKKKRKNKGGEEGKEKINR